MSTPAARHDAESVAPAGAHRRAELLPVALVLLCAWSLLASQALLAPRIGQPSAVLLSFLAVTALVIATRRGARAATPQRAAVLGALGVLAGYASLPAWVAAIGLLGSALGLHAVAPPPRSQDPLLWIAVVGVAPVFEELLYRERVLLALRGRIGAGLAVLLSSAGFALPHLEAWPLLATFLVGVALGALMLATRSLALCIGLHAGLNLAAVVCGIPPARLALPPSLALAASAGLLGAVVLALRSERRKALTQHAH